MNNPSEAIVEHLLHEPSIAVWIAFALLTLIVLGGAIITITRKNLVSAAMALVATFFGIAGFYAMLSAHFLAAIQILVYAGGIMVLFVFVVMVLNREESEPISPKGIFGKVVGGGAAAYVVLRFAFFLYDYGKTIDSVVPHRELPADFGTVRSIGEVLFTKFLFPFEAISILLLIAVIAAVVLARGFASQATSMYDIPKGELDTRQPAHHSEDELIDLPHHHPPTTETNTHDHH